MLLHELRGARTCYNTLKPTPPKSCQKHAHRGRLARRGTHARASRSAPARPTRAAPRVVVTCARRVNA
eukprot:3753942-Lingulodinium_polyedra.AAC.1